VASEDEFILSKLPSHPGFFKQILGNKERVHAALHGGDDYELLFCVARRNAPKIPKRISGIQLTEIGEITADPKSR